MTPQLQFIPYRAVHYRTERHLVSLVQDQSLGTKIVSSLEVRAETSPLPCGQEQDVFITYTVAGEEEGVMDLIYLVGGAAGHAHFLLQSSQFFTGEGNSR